MVKMELLPNELKKVFEDFPLYSQDGKGKEAKVIAKYFNPAGRGTFYALEGSPMDDGDFRFFGFIDLFDKEFGYFTLSELESVQIPINIEGLGSGVVTIERDLYLDPAERSLAEVLKEDNP